MVLVDTPGVGSSDRRSTEVAHAALPNCDAAIFVFSVDPPPPTEAELDYLVRVARQTDRLAFVLNKVDLVDASECAESLGLRRVDGREGGRGCGRTRGVSRVRRGGAEGEDAGDLEAGARSGLAALEAHVRSAFVGTKRAILTAAVARRLAAIAAELEDDVVVERRALVLPLAVLDGMIAGLDRAEADMGRARTAVQAPFRGQ